MEEVLEQYPCARRALFKQYHIGGCASCGFEPRETLSALCERNNRLDVGEVLDRIRVSHEQDEKILINPADVASIRSEAPGAVKLLDIRTRQEFEAVHIEGSLLMSQDLMQEILTKWPRDQVFVLVDHQGKQCLDGAAYFLGHGYEKVRAMRGGIDAWARDVEPSLPRYDLA